MADHKTISGLSALLAGTALSFNASAASISDCSDLMQTNPKAIQTLPFAQAAFATTGQTGCKYVYNEQSNSLVPTRYFDLETQGQAYDREVQRLINLNGVKERQQGNLDRAQKNQDRAQHNRQINRGAQLGRILNNGMNRPSPGDDAKERRETMQKRQEGNQAIQFLRQILIK